MNGTDVRLTGRSVVPRIETQNDRSSRAGSFPALQADQRDKGRDPDSQIRAKGPSASIGREKNRFRSSRLGSGETSHLLIVLVSTVQFCPV